MVWFLGLCEEKSMNISLTDLQNTLSIIKLLNATDWSEFKCLGRYLLQLLFEKSGIGKIF